MRKSPFIVAIPILLTAIALSLTALLQPDWVVSTPPHHNPYIKRRIEYGLWRKCVKTTKKHYSNSLVGALALGGDGGQGEGGKDEGGRSDGEGDDPLRLGQWVCEPFPARSECEAKGTGSFCVLWSTAGYLGLLSLVPNLVSCVALFIIAVGLGERQVRKSRRKRGWKGIAGCSLGAGLLQIATFAIIVHVFRTDGARFERSPESSTHLHSSMVLFLVSTGLSFLLFAALTYTGLQARAGKVWAGGRSAAAKVKGKQSAASRRTGEEAPLLHEAAAGEGEEA